MTLVQAQRNAAYLATGAAFASILLSGEVPAPVTAIASLAFVLSYLVGERTAGQLSAVWATAILGSLVFLGFQVLAGGVDIVLATCIFAMLVALHRLFNRRSVHDYAFLHLFGLLMIAGGSTLSETLAFGGSFAIFAVATTWSLTLTHLRTEVEALSEREGEAAAAELQRVVTGRLLLSLGAMAVGALLVATVIFVAFPRVSFGIGRRSTSGVTRTGFSSQVSLGGHGRLKNDTAVAFRVRVLGETKRGAALEQYWRGATFDRYDGRGWLDTSAPPRTLPENGPNGYRFAAENGPVDEFEVTLPADLGTDTLFVTGRPTAIHLDHQQAGLERIDPPLLSADGLGDLTRGQSVQRDLKYRLRSAPQPYGVARRGQGGNYPEPVRERFLSLPKVDPRIERLARELTAGRDPVDAVYAVEAHLKAYRYTLDLLAGGPDPLSSFLFDVKAGHCEYFATAMAVLLRSAGIPARVVTGFFGGRYVERGGYFALREGDAHGWVEVYFPHEGWVTFDPTPPQSREAMVGEGFAAFQLWLDGVRTAWRTSVVDYDLATQMRGLKGAMAIMRDAGTRLGGRAGQPETALPGKKVALVVGSLGLAGLLAAWLWRHRPRRAAGPTLTPDQQRASLLYRVILGHLRARGIEAVSGETAATLIEKADAAQLPERGIVALALQRYEQSRYGAEPLTRQTVTHVRRSLRRIR